LAILIHAGDAQPLEQLRQDLPPGFAELVRHTMASDRDKRLQSALELRQRLERYGNVSFLTQASMSSLPPPGAVQARSIAMATSGVGVSMRTPVQPKSQHRALLAVLGGFGLAAAVGLYFLVRTFSPWPSLATVPSGSPSETNSSGVAAEPSPVSPTAAAAPGPAVVLAPAPDGNLAHSGDVQPPPSAGQPPATKAAAGLPSSAPSAQPALRSPPVSAPTGKPGRAEERGLAQDNPFK
jgi:hypothetical protein